MEPRKNVIINRETVIFFDPSVISLTDEKINEALVNVNCNRACRFHFANLLPLGKCVLKYLWTVIIAI